MQAIKIDDATIKKAKNGDNDALNEILEKSTPVVKSAVRSLFLADGDKEDLFVAGWIGISKAVASYDGSISFESYLYTCARNSAYSEIKRSHNLKNQPLNSFVSLSETEDGDIDKSKLIISEVLDPETEYINKESEEELKISIKEILSVLEYRILLLYLDGYSYNEIANEIGKSEKSIDNAIQRIRAKIKKLLKKEK